MTASRRRPPVDWDAVADLALPELQPAGRSELRPGARYDGLAFDDLAPGNLVADDLAPGDLVADDANFLECRLRGCVIEDAGVRRARLRSCLLEDLRMTALDTSDSTWADVVVRGTRIGALVAHGASFVRVTIERGHLDYVNLRGATMTQCQFLDCRIGELDLGGAEVRDVRFRRCKIDSLAVRGATLDAADLRGARLAGLDGVGSLAGAVVTDAQLVALAPALAAHLGIRVLAPE